MRLRLLPLTLAAAGVLGAFTASPAGVEIGTYPLGENFQKLILASFLTAPREVTEELARARDALLDCDEGSAQSVRLSLIKDYVNFDQRGARCPYHQYLVEFRCQEARREVALNIDDAGPIPVSVGVCRLAPPPPM